MEQPVRHSLVQTLRSLADFADLDETTLLGIAGESMNLCWKAGSIIFSPGQTGEALYIVLTGECSISDDGGHEVSHAAEGSSFGEMSLLLNATHSKTARALTDCEILVLPKEAFQRMLAENTALSDHFDRVLKERAPETSPSVI